MISPLHGVERKKGLIGKEIRLAVPRIERKKKKRRDKTRRDEIRLIGKEIRLAVTREGR